MASSSPSTPADLTTTPPSRRVRRRTGQGLSSKAQDALAQQLEWSIEKRQDDDIDFIVKCLRDKPELIVSTRGFVEAGGLESVAPRDTFPRGVRKLENIPVRDKCRAIAVVANISEELLKGVEEYEANIPRLFYWMCGLPKNYAVVHKVRGEFFQQTLRPAYVEAGQPLAALTLDAEGTPLDWVFEHGHYKLVKDADGGVTTIVHNKSRSVCPIPLRIPESRLSTFNIENNEFERLAKLTGQFNESIESSIMLISLQWPEGTFNGAVVSMPPATPTPTVVGSIAGSPAPSVAASLVGDGAPEADADLAMPAE